MSGGSQNTVSQQTVPDWLKPYYTYGLSKGESLATGPGPQYYPGQQVAPLNSQQQQGLSSISNAAQTTGGANNNALNANAFETSGALLNPNANPYLSSMFNTAADSVRNQVGSEFAGAGSNITNSAPVLSDQLNNLATQLYGGEYNTGLQNMTMAQGLTPQLTQSAYLPGNELLQAGQTTQQQQQNEINAQMQKYNYQQTLPYNQLSWYSNLLGQNAQPFGGSSGHANMQNNPVMTGLGLGMAGAGLYGMLGGGAAAGGGLMSDVGLMADAAMLA